MRSLYQQYRNKFERYAVNAKLTEEVVRLIRRRVSNGERQVDVASDLQINPRTVNDIVKRRTWKHVE